MTRKAKVVKAAVLVAVLVSGLNVPPSPWVIALLISAWGLGAIDGIGAAFGVIDDEAHK